MGTPESPAQVSLDPMVLKSLGGLLLAASAMLFMHSLFVLQLGFSMIVLLVLLRLLTRRTWIAVALWIPIFVILTGRFDSDVVVYLLVGAMTLTIFFRFGVLSLMVLLGLSGMQVPIPAALNPSAWYAGPSVSA